MTLRRALLVSALILLASLVRFWRIDAQSLWFDEGIAWHVATQPDLPAAIAADPTNPPLYFLLLYAGVRLGGDTEFAMRWLSVMIGLLYGYDVIGPTGAPTGKDLDIGAWTVQPGADWSRTAPPASDTARAPLTVTPRQILLRHDADTPRATPLRNGDRIRLTLLWQSEAPLPPLMLTDASAGWRVDVPARVNGTGILLDWREVHIPASAPDGTAELRLPDGRILARYSIAALPAEFVEPAYATPVSATFPGIGSLIGYTLANDPQGVDRSAPLSITLIWQAHTTPETSYTVFAQVLDAQGRLIAQSDALPAQGARPTTGWRPGEYIIDTHKLIFKPEAAPGPARIIVGLYNAVTGQRALPANDSGDAAISLPTPLTLR